MRKTMIRLMTVLLIILMMPISALAAQEDDCSLTLFYSKEGTAFPGLEIEIYRVAKILPDGDCELVDPFRVYPVKVNGITSQKEWRDTANTLAAYIAADGISPSYRAVTDDTGTARFPNVVSGLYLVRGITKNTEKGLCSFENFMIFLPTPQADGSFDHDVEAKPKGTFTPVLPVEQEFKIVKLWKDSGYTSSRPLSIEVEIYKNGIFQETVILNRDNNWTYTWKAPAGNDEWTVVERNVPRGYKVVITTTGFVFTITNTRTAPPSAPPGTGDTFLLIPLLYVMCISGFLLVVLGIWHERKRR